MVIVVQIAYFIVSMIFNVHRFWMVCHRGASYGVLTKMVFYQLLILNQKLQPWFDYFNVRVVLYLCYLHLDATQNESSRKLCKWISHLIIYIVNYILEYQSRCILDAANFIYLFLMYFVELSEKNLHFF